VNAKDNNGDTALYWASKRCWFGFWFGGRTVTILKEWGAE